MNIACAFIAGQYSPISAGCASMNFDLNKYLPSSPISTDAPQSTSHCDPQSLVGNKKED